jgi:hypothetical protein
LLRDERVAYIVESIVGEPIGVVTWRENHLNYAYRIQEVKGGRVLTKAGAVLIAKHFAGGQRAVDVTPPVSGSGEAMLSDLGFRRMPRVPNGHDDAGISFRLSREAWTLKLSDVAAKFGLIG